MVSRHSNSIVLQDKVVPNNVFPCRNKFMNFFIIEEQKVINQCIVPNTLVETSVGELHQSEKSQLLSLRCYLMAFLAFGLVDTRHLLI